MSWEDSYLGDAALRGVSLRTMAFRLSRNGRKEVRFLGVMTRRPNGRRAVWSAGRLVLVKQPLEGVGASNRTWI